MCNDNDLEERIIERLERLHGAPIDKEMGGKVDYAKARMLLDILGVQYNSIKGEREHEIDFIDDTRPCVDLSGVLESCEEFK